MKFGDRYNGQTVAMLAPGTRLDRLMPRELHIADWFIGGERGVLITVGIPGQDIEETHTLFLLPKHVDELRQHLAGAVATTRWSPEENLP